MELPRKNSQTKYADRHEQYKLDKDVRMESTWSLVSLRCIRYDDDVDVLLLLSFQIDDCQVELGLPVFCLTGKFHKTV